MARKPKTTKAASAGKKASNKPAEARAKKATASSKAPAKTDLALLEPDTFARFTGYVTDSEDGEERLFDKGDAIYIVAAHEATDEQPPTYDVIPGELVAIYKENPDDSRLEGERLVTQEVTTLTGRALQQAQESYLPVPSVGQLDEIIENNGGDLIAAADSVYNEIEEGYFYLGGLLANIRQSNQYHVEAGGNYEGETAWDDFCKDHFQFSGAKGSDLARLYNTFANLPDFNPDMIKDIGWSKIRETIRYVTDDNYQELIEDARNHTKAELKQALVKKYADAEGNTPSGSKASRGSAVTSVNVSFRVSEEIASSINIAIEEAQKLYGVDSPGAAFERIVMAWAEDHVGSASKQKKIVNKIKKHVDSKSSGDSVGTKKTGTKKAATKAAA